MNRDHHNQQGLPCQKAADLEVRPQEEVWMVENFWGQGSVGIIGAAAKSCKSWVGLDLAVSVASGTDCLGHFPVAKKGVTLVYLAEDSLAMTRDRIGSICRSRNLDIRTLDLFVVTAPTLRLDLPTDQERLEITVDRLRPSLLVLDPLVRLHRLDENNARDISGLLGYLRDLQRKYDLAVVLIHHVRKRPALKPGQALRGSSDLYAWTDVTVHLMCRSDETIRLEVEHRAALSPPPVLLKLRGAGGEATHLEVVRTDRAPASTMKPSLGQIILETLEEHNRPLSTNALRKLLNVQKQRLINTLRSLNEKGLVERIDERNGGWSRAREGGSTPQPTAKPVPPEQPSLF